MINGGYIYRPKPNKQLLMNKSTRNTLRLISVILVLALVLMELNIIPNFLNYKFWFMVVAYALALVTYR